jgi:hypothetical protein
MAASALLTKKKVNEELEFIVERRWDSDSCSFFLARHGREISLYEIEHVIVNKEDMKAYYEFLCEKACSRFYEFGYYDEIAITNIRDSLRVHDAIEKWDDDCSYRFTYG